MTRRLGQLVADGVKMLGKEDIVPAGADGAVFRLAPTFALTGAFLPFAVLPFAQYVVMLETPVSALFAIAVSGITVMALHMAGWGSATSSRCSAACAPAQLVSRWRSRSGSPSAASCCEPRRSTCTRSWRSSTGPGC